MEENRKHIDDLFKKELGSYTEVPPGDIWASLDKRLDNTPQPKVAGKPNTWVWYLVAALVIGVILFFVFNNLGSDKDKEKEDEKIEQTQHSSSALTGPNENGTLTEAGSTEEDNNAKKGEPQSPGETSKDDIESGSNLNGQAVNGTETKSKDGSDLSARHAHSSSTNKSTSNNSGSLNKTDNQSSQTGRWQSNKSAGDNTGNGDLQTGRLSSNNGTRSTVTTIGIKNGRKRTGNVTKARTNQSVGSDKVTDKTGENDATANGSKSTGIKTRNNSKRGADNSNATGADAGLGSDKATNATGNNDATTNGSKSTGNRRSNNKKGSDKNSTTSTDKGLGSDKVTNATGDNSITVNASKSTGGKQQGNTKKGTGNDNATSTDVGAGNSKATNATNGNTADKNTTKSAKSNKKGSGNKKANNPNTGSTDESRVNDKVANSATNNDATNAGKSADKKKAGDKKKSAEYSSANDVAKTNSESGTQKNNSTDPQSGSANKNAGTKTPPEPKAEPTTPTANKGSKQDESPGATATKEKPQQEPALKEEAAEAKKDIQYEKGFTASNREEGGIKVSDYLNSASGNAGGDKQTANEEQGKTAGKGGSGGGASDEQEKDKKKRTNKFDFGVKAGFETGFNSYKSNKVVVSPYIQYALARNISVLLQPTVKYATINKTELDGQKSFYRQGISTLDSAHTIIPNPDTLLPDQIIRRYYYQGKYDSISVTNSIAEKKYWEIELPLLLQYKLSKQLSLFFGGAVNISKVVQVKDEFKEIAMTLQDSVIYPIAPEPEPGPPVTPANQKFVYTGTPFSQYSNSASNSSTNPMRVSLMFGINYHVTDRLFFDIMIQQTVSNTKYIPNNSIRDIYKQSYVRFGIGYRFSK